MFTDRDDREAPAQHSGLIKLSGPLNVNISVYRGDSGRFRITVYDIGGDPVDLTGATWDADIRVKASDVDVITNFEVVPVVDDPASVEVILSAENSELLPSTCVYDVEMRQLEEVHTLITGTITVTQDVSRP